MTDYLLVGGAGSQSLSASSAGISPTVPGGGLTSTDVFTVYGDSSGTISIATGTIPGSAANDTITGANAVQVNYLYGDAYTISTGAGRGGDDSIVGGSNVGAGAGLNGGNYLFGDAYQIINTNTGTFPGSALGGNDTIRGALAGPTMLLEYIYGDAFEMYSYSATANVVKGGNDVLFGSSFTQYSNVYGDAGSMMDVATGGNDSIVGGSNALRSILVGDSYDMGGTVRSGKVVINVKGGDDTIWGGSGTASNVFASDRNNYLVGDGYNMFSGATSGKDKIISRGNPGEISFLIGDGYTMNIGSKTGADELYSGAGDDYMYGDNIEGSVSGSVDSFVFRSYSANGQDEVSDFDYGKSKSAVKDQLVFGGEFLNYWANPSNPSDVTAKNNALYTALKSSIDPLNSSSSYTFFDFTALGAAPDSHNLIVFGLPSTLFSSSSTYAAFQSANPGILYFDTTAIPVYAPPVAPA